MPDGVVAGLWHRIVSVLEERAPVTARHINGPADAGTLERLRSAIDVPLPPDLTQWLSLANGAGMTSDATIVPSYLAYDVDQIIATNRMRHEIHANPAFPGPTGLAAGDDSQRLWPGEYWLFIPIATSGAGRDLVVDLRDGDLRGCLMVWHRDGGFGACWPSIPIMLAEIADALEHGRPEGREPTDDEIAHRTRNGYLAVFTAAGTLAWHDYGSEQARIRHREILKWARDHGYKIGERGRISQSVVDAYERRHEH